MLFLRTKYRCAASIAPYPPSHTHTHTHILTTMQQQHWSAHGCVQKNLMVSKVLSGQRVKPITAVFTETGSNVSLKNSSPHLSKHLLLQLPGGYYNSCHYACPSFLSAERPLQQQIPLNVLRQTVQPYRTRACNGHNLAGFVFGQANSQWSAWGTRMLASKSLFYFKTLRRLNTTWNFEEKVFEQLTLDHSPGLPVGSHSGSTLFVMTMARRRYSC